VGTISWPPDVFYEDEPAVALPTGTVLILGKHNDGRPASMVYEPDANVSCQGPQPLYHQVGGYAGLVSDHAVLFADGNTDFLAGVTQNQAEIFEWE
jgi:hypothetical protein